MFKYFYKPLIFAITILFFSILPITRAALPPNLSVGDKVPEVELPDQNGNNLKLSSLKGNLVLLNFWSTWCAACNVIKNPEYVSLYNKWRDYTFGNANEFNIYSVAFDSDKDKWIQRINEAELNWDTHVVDTKSYRSPYWVIFDLEYIPGSFLIDETGHILGINLSQSQIDAELEKRKTGLKSTNEQINLIAEASDAPINTSKNNEIIAPVQSNSKPSTTNTPKNTTIATNTNTKPSTTNTPKNTTVATNTNTKPSTTNTPKNTTAATNTNTKPSTINTPKNTTAATNTNTKPSTINAPKDKDSILEATTITYKIQIGVLSNNNTEPYKSLADLGSLETERVTSRLYRVLLGNFSQQEAQQVLKTVYNRGFADAFVVERNSKPQMPKVVITKSVIPKAVVSLNPSYMPPSSIYRNIFKVQLGLVKTYNEKQFDNLKTIGPLSTETTSDGIAVFVGRYLTQMETIRALAKIKTNGYSDAFVVTRQELETNSTELVADLAQINSTEELMSLADTNFPLLKSTMISRIAPDIQLTNIDGAMLPLSSQNDKLTLVYFWATWSQEARDNLADLVQLHQQYGGNDFEIFTVAFDNDNKRWLDVLKKENLTWATNVIDTKGTNSEWLKKYKVELLPALFLIDKNGRIVGENLHYEQIEEEIKIRLSE